MYDFDKLVFLDDNSFKNELAEIDSADIISYLKNCNDPKIKDTYYKKTKKIFGGNYSKYIKIAVNYDNKITNRNILKKSLLLFLNIILSSILCLILFSKINNVHINANGEALIPLFFCFLVSIFPQILLTIVFHFINKIKRTNKFIEIVTTMMLGIVISIYLVYNSTNSNGEQIWRNEPINDLIHYGIDIGLPIIISGTLFRILLYKIKDFQNVA
jgi:hypothetical protein